MRLLIVDDSKLIRDALVEVFSNDENIMIETASDGLEAISILPQFMPNIITLDINMPVLDGIGTLKRIMIEQPVPVVMLSSLTQEGAKITFDALRYGAVDFIPKPTRDSGFTKLQQMNEIYTRVRNAADVQLSAIRYIRQQAGNQTSTEIVSEEKAKECGEIVSIGAAEGSYGALIKIIPQLRKCNERAYIVSLHQPVEYVNAFIEYLNNCSQLQVKRAEAGATVEPDCCYISSAENYTTVHRESSEIILHVSPAPFSNRRGSIDMLMFSSTEIFSRKVTGIILSGLGEDGIEGIEEVIRVGGNAYVQSPETSLYKEMPSFAINKCDQARSLAEFEIATILNTN